MRNTAFSMLCSLTCLAATGAGAQSAESFQSGWFIVEKPARFAVLMPTAGDMRSAAAAAKASQNFTMQLGVGEAVICFARQGEVTYCFESAGRASGIRGKGALTAAAPGGTPALVTKNVKSGDREVKVASTVWVIATAPDGNNATVQLDGGTRLDLPSDSLRFLSNVLSDATADKEWLRAK